MVEQGTGAACNDSHAWDLMCEVVRFVNQPEAVRVDKASIDLGRMFSAALTKIMSGQMCAAISRAQAQAFERKEWLPRRTILAMVYQRNESSRDHRLASGVPALVSLKRLGDNRRQGIILRRNQAVQASGMAFEEVGEHVIRYSHVPEPKVLKWDLQHAERAAECAPENTLFPLCGRTCSIMSIGISRVVQTLRRRN